MTAPPPIRRIKACLNGGRRRAGLWICAGDAVRRQGTVAGWADLAPSDRPDFAW